MLFWDIRHLEGNFSPELFIWLYIVYGIFALSLFDNGSKCKILAGSVTMSLMFPETKGELDQLSIA